MKKLLSSTGAAIFASSFVVAHMPAPSPEEYFLMGVWAIVFLLLFSVPAGLVFVLLTDNIKNLKKWASSIVAPPLCLILSWCIVGPANLKFSIDKLLSGELIIFIALVLNGILLFFVGLWLQRGRGDEPSKKVVAALYAFAGVIWFIGAIPGLIYAVYLRQKGK
jgi:hypothetical protein